MRTCPAPLGARGSHARGLLAGRVAGTPPRLGDPGDVRRRAVEDRTAVEQREVMTEVLLLVRRVAGRARPQRRVVLRSQVFQELAHDIAAALASLAGGVLAPGFGFLG